jgi:PEGA domain
MLAKEKVYLLQLFGSEEYKNDLVNQFEGKGDFELISEPEGANISIDGIPSFQETTPYSFEDFNAGSYQVSLTKFRYEVIDTVIVIEKDRRNRMKIEFSPLFGNLSVTSEPSDCTVLINNQKSGVTPLNLKGADSGLDAGIYYIKVQKSGSHKISYGIYRDTIEIICGESVNIEAALPAQYGSISLSSNNDRTKYEVIDQDTKESVYKGKNIEKLQLLTGSYKINADNPECLPKSKSVDVPAQMNEDVKFSYRESDYKAFQRRCQNDRDTFRHFIYEDNHNNMRITESILAFIIPDSLKATTTFRYAAYDNFTFMQIPLLGKVSFLRGEKVAFTYGFSFIGNISFATESDFKGWGDLVSVNGGFIFLSKNYRSRLHIECDVGIKFGLDSYEDTYEYNNHDITYCSLDYDTEDKRTIIYPVQWVPVDLSCTYEHYIGGRAFIMLRAGLLYMSVIDNDYHWYDKSAAEAWKSDGTDKPEQIDGDDLPPLPYLEGFKPYFGIGIRF